MDIDGTYELEKVEGSMQDGEVAADIGTTMSDNTQELNNQPIQEDASQDWQSQTFQVFECQFAKETTNHGIVKSFTTKNIFNSTVGEARLDMGIKDDHHRMTNGCENNFFKSVKWSPDGLCLLSSSNDNCLRIFALPDATTTNLEDTPLTAGVLIKEGEVVYDMCWYPAMNSQDPTTCCVLSSSRDHPVHLWDAFTGELRCSYTIVDHCEVNIAPNALCFNLDGSKIYCGSNNMIQIFDTTRPGRDSYKRPTVPTRKSRKGQKGVISCLAFNPDHSDLYAAGSYLKTIGLYDSRAEELLLLLRDKDNHKQQAGSHAQKPSSSSPSRPMGGVTQVQFSPDGMYLYSASRQDPLIRCWDIRNTSKVLHRLERPGELTNQRISFDISCDGRWLCTGDMNGNISIFDLSDPESAQDTDPETRLSARIHAHDDVISAATFHPSGSLLATSSGQRKYELLLNSDDSDSSESEDSEDIKENIDTEMKKVEPPSQSKISEPQDPGEPEKATIDNSIRIWTLPGEYVWYVNGQRWNESTSMDTTDPSLASLNPDLSVSLDSGSAVATVATITTAAASITTTAAATVGDRGDSAVEE
ncbi:Telomerase Cajal body protein 1 [Entomortierella chlamydospora]|uniref:Telomerase Cajal body protein 1 n=1 Tax=Entomortierella chlamydospora TaxID=101097 RepID=A0A9P6SVX5_9FUNG|nr:Telomerase Cajal body protein 1 [Entomortierella chlamydospora]